MTDISVPESFVRDEKNKSTKRKKKKKSPSSSMKGKIVVGFREDSTERSESESTANLNGRLRNMDEPSVSSDGAASIGGESRFSTFASRLAEQSVSTGNPPHGPSSPPTRGAEVLSQYYLMGGRGTSPFQARSMVLKDHSKRGLTKSPSKGSVIYGEQAPPGGLITYRLHKRLMGWKLTTPSRRRDLISLLDFVDNKKNGKKNGLGPNRLSGMSSLYNNSLEEEEGGIDDC